MAIYDPDFILFTWNGIMITGFASGTFLQVSRMTDTNSSEVGANGDVTVVRSRDKRGTITFTLMKESPVNDLLAAVLKIDEATNLGKGVAEVRNLNGTTLHHATVSWLRKPPDDAFSTEADSIEYTVDCERLEMFSGGALV